MCEEVCAAPLLPPSSSLCHPPFLVTFIASFCIHVIDPRHHHLRRHFLLPSRASQHLASFPSFLIFFLHVENFPHRSSDIDSFIRFLNYLFFLFVFILFFFHASQVFDVLSSFLSFTFSLIYDFMSLLRSSFLSYLIFFVLITIISFSPHARHDSSLLPSFFPYSTIIISCSIHLLFPPSLPLPSFSSSSTSS